MTVKYSSPHTYVHHYITTQPIPPHIITLQGPKNTHHITNTPETPSPPLPPHHTHFTTHFTTITPKPTNTTNLQNHYHHNNKIKSKAPYTLGKSYPRLHPLYRSCCLTHYCSLQRPASPSPPVTSSPHHSSYTKHSPTITSPLPSPPLLVTYKKSALSGNPSRQTVSSLCIKFVCHLSIFLRLLLFSSSSPPWHQCYQISLLCLLVLPISNQKLSFPPR